MDRKLYIKSGMVRRLTREYSAYENEVRTQKDKILKMQDSAPEEHVLRKQEEILQESINMLPDTRRRLQVAYDGLKDFMKSVDTDESLTASEHWSNALENLARAETDILNSN